MYVQGYLDSKATDVLSKFTTISNKLRDRHLQSLYTIAYYSFSAVFQYWIQHCYPDTVRPAALRIDAALLQVAQLCIPGLDSSDGTTMHRLSMPARFYGGGLRSMADLAPAAFLGTLSKALPLFLDSRRKGRLCLGSCHASLAP